MSTATDRLRSVFAVRGRKRGFAVLTRTLRKAWDGGIFSEAAAAAFWQALSLAPLLLALLGCLGYVGDWLGHEVVGRVESEIVDVSGTIFSTDVVASLIAPTVRDMLTVGKGKIASVGFLVALWAGSSAMASFIDAITAAHDQHRVRNEVWQRILALLVYIASLAGLLIVLPLIAIGPTVFIRLFPAAWKPVLTTWVTALYYPTLGVGLLLALATLYKLALPRRLPWHRGLPGAALAMLIFLLSSVGLRFYISWITTTGYTYGALATPIAFLLFTFFIGLAIVGGSYFNSAIQELWPAKMTRRQRRKWRRLEMERTNERIRSEEHRKLWERTTMPLRKPRKPAESAAESTTEGGEQHQVAGDASESGPPAAEKGSYSSPPGRRPS